MYKQKIFLSLIFFIIIVLLSVMIVYRENFDDCACPVQVETTCKTTQYYCPLDKKCHDFCQNVLDSKGNVFPCDEESYLPYDPNSSVEVTFLNGTSKTINEVLIPEKDFKVGQLNFEVERSISGATKPKTKEEKYRQKIFNTPSCKLVTASKSAVFSPYSKTFQTIFLTADTVNKYGDVDKVNSNGQYDPKAKPSKEVQYNYEYPAGSKTVKDVLGFETISFPNASRLEIRFSKCRLDATKDMLNIYKSYDRNLNSLYYNLKGDGKNITFPEKLIIDGNTFTWEIISKNSSDTNLRRLRMYIKPYYSSSPNVVNALMVSSTQGLEVGYRIKVGTEESTIVDIKSNIIYVPRLKYSHFKGEPITIR